MPSYNTMTDLETSKAESQVYQCLPFWEQSYIEVVQTIAATHPDLTEVQCHQEARNMLWPYSTHWNEKATDRVNALTSRHRAITDPHMDAAQLEALQKCIEELENKNKCLSEERASLEKELDKSNRKCNAQASTIEYTQKLLEGVEAHACALTEGNRKLLRKNSALEAALFLAKI